MNDQCQCLQPRPYKTQTIGGGMQICSVCDKPTHVIENEVPPFGDNLGDPRQYAKDTLNDVFVEIFGHLQESVHKNAVDKGWWDNEDADFIQELVDNARCGPNSISSNNERLEEIATKLRNRNDGEMLALMHSELSEALEGLRHGNGPSDHIPEFNCAEEELADVVIRAMDMAQKRGWRLGKAIIAKAKFNSTRPHKHGGKKF